jgi:hypothetical protein
MRFQEPGPVDPVDVSDAKVYAGLPSSACDHHEQHPDKLFQSLVMTAPLCNMDD